MAKLSGKIAVVTGATGGLGVVVCRWLLKEGAIVFGLHSGRRSFSEIEGANPEQYQDIPVDITSLPSVNNAADNVLSSAGRIDIVCHLAGGISPKRPVEEVPLEEWNAQWALNTSSLFFLLKTFLPAMKHQGSGRIISIGARPVLRPEGLKSAYAVSKAGLVALTSTVAQELSGYPEVSIHSIIPGTIDTAANREWGTPAERESWISPDVIAESIVRICSAPKKDHTEPIITMFT